jgi:DNA ligase-1
MLASPIDLTSVKYPVYCSPKFDGIRCVIRDGLSLSRKLKPIPNKYVSKMLTMCNDNLDGELIVSGRSFNQIQSAIMSEDGKPDFEFHIFDLISDKPYVERMVELAELKLPKFCYRVLPKRIQNEKEMLAYERMCVDENNYEGIMIRSPNGPYKFGRSTVRQGYLLKLKRFQDSEARIVGFEEMMHNENEKTKDELGHSKRSHKKAGMVAAGVLGAFVVEMDDGKQFKVSTGMTADDRVKYWESRNDMLGKFVKYKFQDAGAKDLPRFPVFLGIRHPDDMS